MDEDELPTEANRFNWLWQKFKDWPHIRYEARKIRKNYGKKNYCNWAYLYNAIMDVLAERFQDKNMEDATRAAVAMSSPLP